MKPPIKTVIRDAAWIDHIKSQERCLISGERRCDPMHIGTLGRGIKSSDDEILPIAHRYHLEGHQSGEISMLRKHLPDSILRLALRAYARELYGDYLREKSA